MKEMFLRALRWLLARPSYMLLAANDDRLAGRPPRRSRFAWCGVLGLSLAWGAALAGLWAAMAAVFGEAYTGLPLIPALSVVLAMTLWLYRCAVLSLAEALVGTANRPLGVCVVVVSLLVAAVGVGRWTSPSLYLPVWLQWMQPYPRYRVIILAPVWGAWSMLVTCQFRKPSADTEPAVVSLAKGAGPISTTVSMGALMAWTLWWFSFLPWLRLLVPAVTVVAAIVGGSLLCRRAGGLRRSALLANNVLTQFVFWMSYLAACR